MSALGEAMPDGLAEPEYVRYRVPGAPAGKGCASDVAVIDLREHKGRTLRDANFAHIARLKDIVVLEDIVTKCV